MVSSKVGSVARHRRDSMLPTATQMAKVIRLHLSVQVHLLLSLDRRR